MEDNKPVNIFFKTNKIKEETLKGSTPFDRYIILQNETLQEENRQLTSKVNDLQTENSSLQEDIDKYDNSSRYFKGLLKNLSELEKLAGIVASEIEILGNKNFNIYKNFKIKAQRHIYYLEAIMILFMGILYEFKFLSQFQSIVVVFIILFNIAFTQNMLNNLVCDNIENPLINNTKKKIDDIHKGQDYLSDYIDNL
jgi:hypothetical protein